jgi:hypothetical protein
VSATSWDQPQAACRAKCRSKPVGAAETELRVLQGPIRRKHDRRDMGEPGGAGGNVAIGFIFFRAETFEGPLFGLPERQLIT